MDNKDNNLNDNNSEFDEVDVQDKEQSPALNEPEKTLQKQSRRWLVVFGFLLSLVALLTAGWVFYRMEFQSVDDQTLNQLDSMASQQDLSQLQNRIEKVEQKLKQQGQLSEQNQQQISQLQQSIRNLPNNKFDASPLKQQISIIQQQLTALNNQNRDQTIEPQTEDYLSALVRAQTINALKMAQLLLNQQQAPQAVEVLKQWRNNKHLPLAVQTRIQQLVTTLSNLETPDVEALRQQLLSIKESISTLSLVTQALEKQEPAWYERFITVKKINPDQQNLNSADLQQLKANAIHAIGQAELALTLKQPVLWRDALKQAEHTLAQQRVDSDSLQQQLHQLRQQNITTKIPDNLGIRALIQQLEDSTE